VYFSFLFDLNEATSFFLATNPLRLLIFTLPGAPAHPSGKGCLIKSVQRLRLPLRRNGRRLASTGFSGISLPGVVVRDLPITPEAY